MTKTFSLCKSKSRTACLPFRPKPQTITWSYLESKCIIRYDERNNYIYLILKKPEDPDCYIGIFNANNGSPIGNDKFFPNIYDIAINKIHDIFYLSRKDDIEVYNVNNWEIPINNFLYYFLTNTYPLYYIILPCLLKNLNSKIFL